MKRSLNGLIGHVENTIDQVNSGADQVAQASQNLSQSSTEQASSLERDYLLRHRNQQPV